VHKDEKIEFPSSTSPSPEDAAAITAALELFLHDTAIPGQTAPKGPDPWVRAAMLEGVMREEHADVPHPWINT
jgi:hypothetical protein